MNPTDDLVSRLRAHGPKRHDARALMNEAAAEIERLRQENEGLELAAFFAKPLYSRRQLEEKLAAAEAALKRARVYVEIVVTDQFADTGTDREDLALIDAALNPPAS